MAEFTAKTASVLLAALEALALPVEGQILFLSFDKDLSEEFTEEVVVRFILEFQSLHVLHVAEQNQCVLAVGF
jgi:hypothetical protein